MHRYLVILLIIVFLLTSSRISSHAEDDSHYAVAAQLVAMTYNKEAAYQNFIRFGLLPAKERYENNPMTIKYSDILVNIVKEVLDIYFNDEETQKNLKGIYTKIYMEEFSKSELKEMIKFYKTQTGQKVLQRYPIIMQKSWERETELGNNFGAPKYQQLITKKVEELQEKGMLPKEFK